jgi:hypothetical protein
MELFNLRVKDLSTGDIYYFSQEPGKNTILEIYHCNNCFLFVVQKIEDKSKYISKILTYPFKDINGIDLMTVNENKRCEVYFDK